MDELHEVADRVVLVLLGVGPHRLAVARQQEADAREVVVGRGCRRQGLSGPVLPEVFATAGLNQPVDGVVGVVGAGFDALVAEEDDVLDVGVVLNVRDVASWIVGIGQVLHHAFVRREAPPGRGQVDQAEGGWIVGVARRCVVAVLDKHSLAFGVVVDVGDERRRGLRAAQIDVKSFEQVRLVVSGTDHAPVWCP